MFSLSSLKLVERGGSDRHSRKRRGKGASTPGTAIRDKSTDTGVSHKKQNTSGVPLEQVLRLDAAS